MHSDLRDTLQIRSFLSDDWKSLWPLLQSTFASGDTYLYSPTCSEEEIYDSWISKPRSTIVVYDGDQLVATYYIKDNQPGLGNHICNAGYVVRPSHRGRGIAGRLCEHSQVLAKDEGYQAMQFNAVASTNLAAVNLWLKHGFRILGTVPNGFRHASLGLVDTHIMWKSLE